MPVYIYCFAEVIVSFLLKQQVLGKVECKGKVFLEEGCNSYDTQPTEI